MKPNEVRVGNWVKFPNGKEAQLEREDFSYHRGLTNIEHLEPILLTEEWLERFGFHSDPYMDTYHKKPLLIQCCKLKGRLELWEEITDVQDLDYVHTLQNLYFALTGEEL